MTIINQFLLEGVDRVGKDTLIKGIQHQLGYHQVLHYSKPIELDCYLADHNLSAQRQYQEASFRTMFQILRGAQDAHIICNRAHLGECIYASYRGYSGEYVFDIEREFNAHELSHTRLLLLVEEFDTSRHFVDDGQSLGGSDGIEQRRRREQILFLKAFERSTFKNKKVICVTDQATGKFRPTDWILKEALS